jgi:hypothetical protein
VHRERLFSHRFHRFGFVGGGGLVGVDGLGGGQVVIIQQFPSSAPSEPREPAKTGIYVSPQWVDGGHGVEVLKPGYWTDAK